MLLYEICKADLRRNGGNIARTIAAGEFIPRDNEFMRNAFNFGHGTIKHMNEYMRNNAIYCIWYNPATGETVKRWK